MVFRIPRCTSIPKVITECALKKRGYGSQRRHRMGTRESFVAIVAIIATNLLMTWGWIRQKLLLILGSLLSSNKNRTTKTSPWAYLESGSIMLGDTNDSSWSGQKNRLTVYSGTKEIFVHMAEVNSEENILPDDKRGGITKRVELTVSIVEVPAPTSLDVSR
ncbi:unnamed protein product [Clonostachys rosea]|uniref:CSD domain-containing protein n=1 Tax=Bionectria ochroleuca TaxID=29856 RepID=A0ABY6UG69_BIOOC|nr:unnamed protein product [Clonostachys rosea]